MNARRESHRLRTLHRAMPLALADASILVTAYLAACSIRVGASPFDFRKGEGPFLLGAVFITLVSLFLFGGYQRIWSRTSGYDVQVIAAAGMVSLAILLGLDFFLRPRPLPLSVLSVGHLITLNGLVAVRYRSRVITGLIWRWQAIWHYEFPQTATRVLIVGAGSAGQTTAWRLKYRAPHDGDGYRVVGFVDDDPGKQGMYLEGSPVLGMRADIPTLVKAHRIDLIVCAIHTIDGPNFRDILSYCEKTNARIKVIPDVFAVLNCKNGVSPLRDIRVEDLLGRQPVSWHQEVDVSPISNKVILVTGAAGSIGSELCRQALNYAPVKLILLDNNESGLHDLVIELKTCETQDIIVPVLADITAQRALGEAFQKHSPQVVIHSAAYKHVPMLEYHPNEAVRVNIGGTRQIAELARAHGVERFVLISTDKAVNPTNVMGASKRICELLMHALSQQPGYKTLFTAVRFGNVLGSRGSVVPLFNYQIKTGGPITVTDKEMTRYFMSIPEAANLVLHAACLTKGDDLFMLQMGEVVRITDLAERMVRLHGLVLHKDISFEFIGARPGEKLHEELHDVSEHPVPTFHPHILELFSDKNGLQPVSFLDRLDMLFQNGLDEDRDPLVQLREFIMLAANGTGSFRHGTGMVPDGPLFEETMVKAED